MDKNKTAMITLVLKLHDKMFNKQNWNCYHETNIGHRNLHFSFIDNMQCGFEDEIFI